MKKRATIAILVLLLLMTGLVGCGAAGQADDAGSAASTDNAVSTAEQDADAESPGTAAAEEPAPLVFEPHVHCSLLSDYVTEDMWASLYNLIDAIRAGEDTFACSDEVAYEWCTDQTVIGTFLPPACMIAVPDGYENGVGKIRYTIGKDEYREREQAFEQEVERILNEAIRSDYSDFEKLMGLYAYMCKYWVFDNTPLDDQGIDDFSDYACIMKKNGICTEVAGTLSYLLLQCGIEATPMGTQGEHDWTYVEIGGKGYLVDATWGLHGEDPDGELTLRYFMMTDEERFMDGFVKEDLEVDQLWVWTPDYDLGRFAATDETFKPIHDGWVYVEMDTERNVLKCLDASGEPVEFSYGDL